MEEGSALEERNRKLRSGKADSGSREALSLGEVGAGNQAHDRGMLGWRTARRAQEPTCDSVTRPSISPPGSGRSWRAGTWRGQVG